jgi:trk system potassium uptake protein TrkH
MSVFEALNTAFATAGTGGFAVKGDGLAGYSSYIQIVVTVFMILFSVNFNSYYMLGKGRWKEIFTEEVRTFFMIVFAAIGLITLNVYFSESIHYNYSFLGALKHTAFSVASVVSTTGFATENFDLWPQFSKTILVLLMFMGACAGSTGGGMKVSRIMIMTKSGGNELRKMLHPKQIRKVTMDKRVVDDEVVKSVNSYLMIYVLVFLVSLLLISLDGASLTTSFTSVVATVNNIGPGLEAVGPAGNFAFYSWWAKLVFIFDMLAGRLELIPMLLLFAPATWRK